MRLESRLGVIILVLVLIIFTQVRLRLHKETSWGSKGSEQSQDGQLDEENKHREHVLRTGQATVNQTRQSNLMASNKTAEGIDTSEQNFMKSDESDSHSVAGINEKHEGFPDPSLTSVKKISGGDSYQTAAKAGSVEDGMNLTLELNITKRVPKLGDGCRHIYLDIGSNIGVQVRKLFEPNLYPNAKILSHFDNIFGPISVRTLPGHVCAFGFEANPVHTERLTRLEVCYKRRGWNVQFLVPKAVSNTDDDTVTLYLDRATKYNFWGASITSSRRSRDPKKNTHQVQTLDLARFLMTEIRGRLIPDAVSGAEQIAPSVYAKFDIEGAEYITLGNMIRRGALCDITHASLEWHSDMYNATSKIDQDQLMTVLQAISALPRDILGCKAMTWDTMDDESFTTDGMPFPENCTDVLNTTRSPTQP